MSFDAMSTLVDTLQAMSARAREDAAEAAKAANTAAMIGAENARGICRIEKLIEQATSDRASEAQGFNTRLRKLERWRDRLLGAVGVITLVLTLLSWKFRGILP